LFVPMQNIKLLLEYDGTDFNGWQYQPNGRSVQEVLEDALKQILREEVKTVAAGRTDAGVHARGQVASCKVERPIEPEELHNSLNGVLPEDVVVLNVERVDDGFHARYSARRRTYSYQIVRRPVSLQRKYYWQVGYRMDESLLHQLSAMIMGEHDFQSFAKNGTTTDHYRCMVQQAEWIIHDDAMIFHISANRFLYGMVRALVGTMIEVARGHRSLDEFPQILGAKNRSAAGMAAPPHGLFLDSVEY
jgi:tRNA pseudouridine38-40 synthase